MGGLGKQSGAHSGGEDTGASSVLPTEDRCGFYSSGMCHEKVEYLRELKNMSVCMCARVCMLVCMCMYVCGMECMWRSEGSLSLCGPQGLNSGHQSFVINAFTILPLPKH